MKTKITRYPGEYVDIGHWFVGVDSNFGDRAHLHIGCEHTETIVTVFDGQAYKTPESDTLLVTSIGTDSSGAPCCTFGFLTDEGSVPVRTEGEVMQ